MPFDLGLLTLTRVGLVLNIVGTLLVACSFGKNLEDAYQEDKKGRNIYLASFLHPKWFTCGLVLIILGFVLQL